MNRITGDYFPLWIRLTHFFNFLFITLLIRSGIEIIGAHPSVTDDDEEEFPDSLDIATQTPARRSDFAKTHVSFERKKTPKTHVSFDFEGLRRLCEALKDITFRLAVLSFKADVKEDAVWIRMMAANQGTQETVASAKATLKILSDAMTMPRDAFRERLERFLRENEFEI